MSEAKNYGFHTAQHLGTRESTLKERSIEQCLNCQKKVCNGCPKDWKSERKLKANQRKRDGKRV